MCKLCERDKGKPTNSLCVGIFPDRLAVLEKDHAAMERLRKYVIETLLTLYTAKQTIKEHLNEDGTIIVRDVCWVIDPADAILGVDKVA